VDIRIEKGMIRGSLKDFGSRSVSFVCNDKEGMPMLRSTALFFVALSLLLVLPLSHRSLAEIVEHRTEPVTSERSGHMAMKTKVISIVLDKIEGSYIYAKDGSKFEMTSSTKIQKDIHPETKIRIAELVFLHDKLAYVTIK
jgi:hypothetical protein